MKVKSLINEKAIMSFLTGTLIFFALYLTSLYSYLLFHGLAEMFSIAVAFGIFMIAWNSRRFLENSSFILIGIAYLFIGIMDLLHTLGYKGMGVFSGYGANLPTQLWIIPRYIESLTFLAFPFLLRSRVKPGFIFSCYAVVTAILLGSIFYWEIFPVCFVEGAGLTPFKKTSEYVISLILLGSIFLIYKRRREFDPGILRMLVASVALTIGSELSFTFYISASGFSYMAGHFLKIASFYFIYTALVEARLQKPYDLLFRELKQSKEALEESEESEERFRLSFEKANIGMCLVDLNGHLFKVNIQMCGIFGYSKEELERMHVNDLAHPDDLDKSPGFIQKSIHEHIDGSTFEKRYFHKDGHQVWGLVSSSLILDAQDNPLYFISHVQDITERKLMEETVRRRTQALGERVKELNCLYGLSKLVEKTGITLRELLQGTVELIPGSWQYPEITCARLIIEDEQYSTADFKESLWKQVSAIMVSGKQAGVLEVCYTEGKPESDEGPFLKEERNLINALSDRLGRIIERKRMETELIKAKEAADAANRAKSSFLANMSHELRTPLNSILGFSQIMEMDSDILSEQHLEFLEYIKNSSDHLLEMVNDILDLSKIEAGKIEIEKKPFALDAMLSRLPSTIQSLMNKKKIQMEVNVDPDLGVINADETRIKQVIYNLLSNAVKFTEPGKRIGIEAYLKDSRSVIEVWDEGIGIAEEDFEKVFDPFEQVGQTDTVKPEGTGLGLAISRRLVEAHGGSITIESKKGAGSRFIVVLPGMIAYGKGKAGKTKVKTRGGKEGLKGQGNILVVEDNENNLKLITSVLEHAGYTVYAAASGKAGSKAAGEKDFDLILMDIQLPEMSGIEAMKRIKKKDERGASIIALTAYAMKGDEEKYLAQGFDGYISKPIDIKKVLETVKELLKQ